MLRRRMMMAQGGVSLPAGYTKIEYLESDGNSYIDTRFVPNQDTRVKMSILASGLSGETYAYGARNSAGSNAFLCALEPTVITFGYAIQYRTYEGVIDGRYDIDQNKNIMTVNGTEISGNYVESFSSESNLTLFGRNTAGSVEKLSAIKLYSCKIYDNGTLVRDFIPAMNASGEAGLYDLKNDVWYALLPVAKPKVENKISVYVEGAFSNRNYGFDFQFPSASQITVTYKGWEAFGDSEYEYSKDIIIAKDATKTNVIETMTSSGSVIDGTWMTVGRTIESIIAIFPTEDDTYIYTF